MYSKVTFIYWWLKKSWFIVASAAVVIVAVYHDLYSICRQRFLSLISILEQDEAIRMKSGCWLLTATVNATRIMLSRLFYRNTFPSLIDLIPDTYLPPAGYYFQEQKVSLTNKPTHLLLYFDAKSNASRGYNWVYLST